MDQLEQEELHQEEITDGMAGGLGSGSIRVVDRRAVNALLDRLFAAPEDILPFVGGHSDLLRAHVESVVSSDGWPTQSEGTDAIEKSGTYYIKDTQGLYVTLSHQPAQPLYGRDKPEQREPFKTYPIKPVKPVKGTVLDELLNGVAFGNQVIAGVGKEARVTISITLPEEEKRIEALMKEARNPKYRMSK